MHIHVAGLGPAGAAFALRAISRGHRVTATEPRWPALEWPATYGVIETEVPHWAEAWFHAPHSVNVRTPSERTLPYRYRMMDKPALLAELHRAAATGTLEVSDRVSGAVGRHLPKEESAADAVLIAHGATHTEKALWQVAVGYVFSFPTVTSSLHTDALEASNHDRARLMPEPCFMDWAEPASDCSCPPSFLYIQPVDEGILVEETVLATHTKPEDLMPELQRRLDERLKHGSLTTFAAASTVTRTETVAIPMGTRAQAWYRVQEKVHFGASGGLIHPATGYNVGASLQAVDQVLDELERRSSSSGHVDGKPRLTSPVIHRQRAELAYLLRQLGGELIARADQRTLADFFACFFRLPEGAQLAYLTGHDGVAVMRTMWRLRKETGLLHPFLRPLWRNPRSVYRAIKRRMQHSGDEKMGLH